MVVVIPELGGPNQSLFCVIDGHGQSGHLVANFAAKTLTKELTSSGLAEGDVHSRLWDGFEATNKQLIRSSNIDCTLSGATLTASILLGTKLTTAWVGDSRALLARKEGDSVKAYDLTVDHKPTLPEEKKRILEAGGRVQPLIVRVQLTSCCHSLLFTIHLDLALVSSCFHGSTRIH
jgi:serine/threonine protein phosphatase PrpC